jgi:glycerophosphoryl diester phosphodiesterase
VEGFPVRGPAIITGALLLLIWVAFWLYTSWIPAGTEVRNLENGSIITLGHGGMGTRSWRTLNTSSSFLKAMKTGAHGTELDVQLTADGMLIAFHDAFAGESQCPKVVSQHTMAELRGCLRELLTAEEVLALGWPDGSVFSLDVKLHGADNAQVRLIGERIMSLKSGHPQFRILVESNSVEFIKALQMSGHQDGLYLYSNQPETALTICVSAGLEGVSIRNEAISAEQVSAFHAKGIRVMLWGVGTRWDNREAVLKAPDIIQSDRLGHLVKLVN